jgi:hypothetical protein
MRRKRSARVECRKKSRQAAPAHLDVAVDDRVLLVEPAQRAQERPDHARGGGRLGKSRLEHRAVVQVAPGAELHDRVAPRSVFEGAEELDDAGVVAEDAHKEDLAPRVDGLLGRERGLVEDLDRDRRASRAADGAQDARVAGQGGRAGRFGRGASGEDSGGARRNHVPGARGNSQVRLPASSPMAVDLL